MSDKVDFKKTLDSYRARVGDWELVEVPDHHYIAIDGEGAPDPDAFAALYAVAYALKFASKAAGRDYVVPPAEGLWWADDMSAFAAGDKSQWRWTLLSLVPPWMDDAAVASAVAAARDKGAADGVDRVEARALSEGRCLQTLHVGSFESEAPVLARLHQEVIPSMGLVPVGQHHEIYLSDPRRTAPEKLRTILRQPVGDA